MSFFDQSSAARLSTGLLKGFNEYAQYHPSSYFDITKNNLLVTLDCNKEQIEYALNHEVEPDKTEASIGSNVVDLIAPHHIDPLDIEWMMTQA